MRDILFTIPKNKFFTFMMVLIFFRCTYLFNNYSTIQLLSKIFIDSDFCHNFFTYPIPV